MNDGLIDMIQAHMSQDIEVAIKIGGRTPVDTGLMKSQVRSFKSPSGGYRVEANAVYSAYQERGEARDGSRKVRNYTTSGTGAGWFQDAIDKTIAKRDNYIDVARKAFGL